MLYGTYRHKKKMALVTESLQQSWKHAVQLAQSAPISKYKKAPCMSEASYI